MFGDPDDNHMGWPKVTFEEISEIITDGEHATPRRSEKGIYLLSARNVLNHSLSFDDVDYIDQEEFDRISKRLIPQAGDVLISCSGTVGRVCTVPENLQFQLVRSVALVRFKKEINPVFMEYQISMPYIQKQIDASKSQTSQANLFQGKIKKLIAIVPSEELQIQFLKFVEQSDKSKFIGFKSQFIEMFGELGKDDKGWGLTTLGECCELNPKRPRDIDDELMVSFVPMPAVSEDGKIDCSEIKPYKEVRKGFTYFAENDVLFAKITPCMENGKGAVAKGLEGGIGSGSTEFHVLRPIVGKSNPYWLYILTMFEAFRVGARKVMTGTGGQLRVPIAYLKDYPISLPPIELQDRFEEIVHQSDKSKLKEDFYENRIDTFIKRNTSWLWCLERRN